MTDEKFRKGSHPGYKIVIAGDAAQAMQVDVIIPKQRLLYVDSYVYSEQKFNHYTGLKAHVKAFLKRNGTFMIEKYHHEGGIDLHVTFAREEAAMLFKLAFA